MESSQHASMRRAKARRRQGQIATRLGSSKGGRPSSARPGSACVGQRALRSDMEELYRQRRDRDRERERDAQLRGVPSVLSQPTNTVGERPFCHMEPVLPPSPLLNQYSPTTPVAPIWPDRLSSAHIRLSQPRDLPASSPSPVFLEPAPTKPGLAPLAVPTKVKKNSAFSKLFSRRKKINSTPQHDPAVASVAASASTSSSQIAVASKAVPDVPAGKDPTVVTLRDAARVMDNLRSTNEGRSFRRSLIAESDIRPGTHCSDQQYATTVVGRPGGNMHRVASRQSISAFFGIPPTKDAEPQRTFSAKIMPNSAFTRPASDASSYQVVSHGRPHSPSISELFNAAPSINGDVSAEQSPFNVSKLNSSYDGISEPLLSFTSIRGNSMPDYFSSTNEASDLLITPRTLSSIPPHHAVYRTINAAQTPVRTNYSPTKQPTSAHGVVHNVARVTSADRRTTAVVRPASKIPIRSGRPTPVSPISKTILLVLPSATTTPTTTPSSMLGAAAQGRVQTEERIESENPALPSNHCDSVTAALLQDDASEGDQDGTSNNVLLSDVGGSPASGERPSCAVFGKLHHRERSPSNFSNGSRKLRPPPLDFARPTRSTGFVEWRVPPTADTIRATSTLTIPRDDSGFNDNGMDILKTGPKYYRDAAITPRRASVMDSDPLFNPARSFGSQADTEERCLRAVSRYTLWAQAGDPPSPEMALSTPDLPESGHTLASSTDIIPRLHPRVAAYDPRHFEDSTRAIKSPPPSPEHIPEPERDYARFVSNTVLLHAYKERVVSDASTQTAQDIGVISEAQAAFRERRVSALFDWALKRSAALQIDQGTTDTVLPRSTTGVPASTASTAGFNSLAGLFQVLQEQMRITKAISQHLQRHENQSTNALNVAMQQIASLESENAALLGRLNRRTRQQIC